MQGSIKYKSYLSAPTQFLYIVFFISVFFSFRAISSISIGILLIVGIVTQRGQILFLVRSHPARYLVAGALIYCLLQFVSFLYTDNFKGTWIDIQQKSGLLLIPLAVILAGPIDAKASKRLLAVYCFSLTAAAIYCICMAFVQYGNTGDSAVFFFHKLVKPIHQHAVYFSIYVFVGLVLLLENIQKKNYTAGPVVSLSIVIFLSALLFLLSSRLVFSFYLLYMVFYLWSLFKSNISKRVVIGLVGFLVIAVSVIFLTRNLIRDKFVDLMHGNLALVRQQQFTPGDYFNGFQFRLLQWKFVPAILNEHQGWWTGVGASHAQAFLNQEYIDKNMYLGDPKTGNIGYRAYNSHNQLLESLLRYGIPGLLVTIFLFYGLIRIMLQNKQRQTRFIIALILIYALIESLFESQYGIVLFVFFPSFLCQYTDDAANHRPGYPDMNMKK